MAARGVCDPDLQCMSHAYIICIWQGSNAERNGEDESEDCDTTVCESLEFERSDNTAPGKI